MKARIAILALAAVLLALAAATLSPSARGEPVSESVLPPGGQPYGQTYSEWAADWWVWALSQPTPTNPLLDNTGRRCAEGQTGAVWFLAGTFAGTASRKCTVPADTALFFPVINLVYCAFTTDPPGQQTEKYVRRQVSFVKDDATGLSASIDGVSVPDIKGRYYEESSLFTVDLPPDNLFGTSEELSLCADAGYYLMVAPLAPGKHTIHFAGSLPSIGYSLDVTYTLSVKL